MDFTAPSGSWIYAYNSGEPLNTDDTSARIRQHNDQGVFDFDFTAARGDNSANPFASASSATTGGGDGGATPTSSSSSSLDSSLLGSSSSESERRRRILIAHGVLASLVFVIMLPAGAIAVRVLKFSGLVKFHAAWQIFAYLTFVAAFGLGVYIANELEYVSAIPRTCFAFR